MLKYLPWAMFVAAGVFGLILDCIDPGEKKTDHEAPASFPSHSRRKSLSFLTAIFFIIYVCALFGSLGLEQHYAGICPQVPDESTGHIYQLQLHGGYVYLTLAEHRTLIVINVLIESFLFSGCGALAWIGFRRRQDACRLALHNRD
jgi:hypothetical protein